MANVFQPSTYSDLLGNYIFILATSWKGNAICDSLLIVLYPLNLMPSRRHSEGQPRTARNQSISSAPLRQSKTNTSTSTSKSLLLKITRNVFHSSSKKTSSSTSRCSQNTTSKPQPESLLFRLPLELREQIYWDVIGRHEVIHILLKHRPARSPAAIAHRRCRARDNVASCMTGKCKELMILDGEYFGWFDRRETGLLYTCRDL
jgi:hypothetical protein